MLITKSDVGKTFIDRIGMEWNIVDFDSSRSPYVFVGYCELGKRMSVFTENGNYLVSEESENDFIYIKIS